MEENLYNEDLSEFADNSPDNVDVEENIEPKKEYVDDFDESVVLNDKKPSLAERWQMYSESFKRGGLTRVLRDCKSRRIFNHEAYLDVLLYDEDSKRFRINRHTCKKKHIKPTDRNIANSKWEAIRVNMELIEEPETEEIYDETTDQYDTFYRPTAISHYLYMKNNSINDAMAGGFTERKGFNPLIAVGLVALGIVILVGYLMFVKI